MMEETAALVPASSSSLVPTSSSLCQIDYRVEDVGKRVRSSKKRITWQFGRTSPQTTSHTVVLCWSKRTGKQYIEMDGSEVYNNRQKGSSIVTHQWTTNDDGMALHVLASRVSPKHLPNLRKYELMINGVAFSSLLFQDGSPPVENVNSLVTILYPDGYDSQKFTNDPLIPIPSTVDEV